MQTGVFGRALLAALGSLVLGCVSGSDLPNGTGATAATSGDSGGASSGGQSTGGVTASGGTAAGGVSTGGVGAAGASGGVPSGGVSGGGTGGLTGSGGGTTITCETGQAPCSGVCVALGTDQNCSACGDACPSGSSCGDTASGAKDCLCPDTTQTACPTAGCVDTQTDPANCGICGNSCGLEGNCSGGACVCAEGTASCTGAGCVDILSSPAHCGADCTACGANETCVEGLCTCPESETLLECTSGCIDVTADPANCGACDAACPDGTCLDGECLAAPCAPFETMTVGQLALGGTGAICIRVEAPGLNGNCSGLHGRTVMVNGDQEIAVSDEGTCSFTSDEVRAFVDGYVYFDVSAGTTEWASMAVWL